MIAGPAVLSAFKLNRSSMSDNSALTRIGITNPSQISRYSLQEINNVDILRIVYKRTKGSLLPVSRKYKFERNEKLMLTDGGRKHTTMSEISPFLGEIIGELSSIVQTKHSRSERKEIITDEINRLEEEMNTRISYLKGLVRELD